MMRALWRESALVNAIFLWRPLLDTAAYRPSPSFERPLLYAEMRTPKPSRESPGEIAVDFAPPWSMCVRFAHASHSNFATLGCAWRCLFFASKVLPHPIASPVNADRFASKCADRDARCPQPLPFPACGSGLSDATKHLRSANVQTVVSLARPTVVNCRKRLVDWGSQVTIGRSSRWFLTRTTATPSDSLQSFERDGIEIYLNAEHRCTR